MRKVRPWELWDWKSIRGLIFILIVLGAGFVFLSRLPDWLRNSNSELLIGETTGAFVKAEYIKQPSFGRTGNHLIVVAMAIEYSYAINGLTYYSTDKIPYNVDNQLFFDKLTDNPSMTLKIKYNPSKPQQSQIIITDEPSDKAFINEKNKFQPDSLNPSNIFDKAHNVVPSRKDPIVLRESYNEEDEADNEYLIEKLKPVRNNFKRINSIKEWSAVDKRKLENMPDNGVAEYYYLNGTLEKIIARYPTNTKQITEYYLLKGQLSFVIEKSIITPEQSELEDSEIVTDKNYFKESKLIHKIHSQDCGAPFADDYLLEEQKRIVANFKSITSRLK